MQDGEGGKGKGKMMQECGIMEVELCRSSGEMRGKIMQH